MARGAASKEVITKKILETFESSFINGKEIRVPMMENGELLQIKIQLTCAKDNIPSPDGELSSVGGVVDIPAPSLGKNENMGDYMTEPSEAEKANVETLCRTLGLI
ncbi:MAG: hypothetical protein [Caudoviricetes sp.]|nr:MAG: hypothetical protein [Caudoviricetes sp.]